VRAAVRFAHHRRGLIAFAVRTEHHFWGFRATQTFPSASVLKAMCLVAYLDHPAVRRRALNSRDLALLGPMIRRSDDNATNQVVRYVGFGRLRALAREAGMRRFRTAPIWGRSRIDATDQSRFLLHIDDFTVARHRATVLQLMSSITPSQRWGIATVRPHGWHLYFKGGWGRGTGWVDHQVALLRHGRFRVAVAILTHNDGSHAYGKGTLRGLGQLLFRGLDHARRVE
jgi:hypothetical protein